MEVLVFLIPIALGLGVVGLAAFIWALKSGQFEDLDGAAMRILNDDDGTAPAPADSHRQAAANSLGSTKSAKR
jgi:cbb3-type cytochrome oxidase maturation protein